MPNCKSHGNFTYKMFAESMTVCAFCDRPVRQPKQKPVKPVKERKPMSEYERQRLTNKAELLKRELERLGVMPEVADVMQTHNDFTEDCSLLKVVRPIRKWRHSYHYAANEPVEPTVLRRTMEIAATVAPLFDVNSWLKTVAQPGARIQIEVRW